VRRKKERRNERVREEKNGMREREMGERGIAEMGW